MENKVLVFMMSAILFGGGFISGFYFYPLISFEDVHDGYVGFYLINSEVSAVNMLTQYPNYKGDWICVDTDDMYDYDYIVETCSHEVAHKIYEENVIEYSREEDEEFAAYCEDDITQCIGVDWGAFNG